MDALRNGIDFVNMLKKEDNVKTVGGSVSSYSLSSCRIIFQTDTGEAYIEDLPFIKIISNEKSIQEPTELSPLGIDVLINYRIRFARGIKRQ